MEILLKISTVMVLCSIPVMLCAEWPRRMTLKKALREEPEGLKKLLRQPLHEVMLGVLISLAVLFFSRICLVGTAAEGVAVGVAYAAAVMCGVGAYIRGDKALGAYGVSMYEKALRIQLAIFSLGMVMLLCGLLCAVIAVWHHLLADPATETAALIFRHHAG